MDIFEVDDKIISKTHGVGKVDLVNNEKNFIFVSFGHERGTFERGIYDLDGNGLQDNQGDSITLFCEEGFNSQISDNEITILAGHHKHIKDKLSFSEHAPFFEIKPGAIVGFFKVSYDEARYTREAALEIIYNKLVEGGSDAIDTINEAYTKANPDKVYDSSKPPVLNKKKTDWAANIVGVVIIIALFIGYKSCSINMAKDRASLEGVSSTHKTWDGFEDPRYKACQRAGQKLATEKGYTSTYSARGYVILAQNADLWRL